MGKLLSPSWWLSMFVTTFMTMLFIYLIKAMTNKFNIPVAKDIANGV